MKEELLYAHLTKVISIIASISALVILLINYNKGQVEIKKAKIKEESAGTLAQEKINKRLDAVEEWQDKRDQELFDIIRNALNTKGRSFR